MFRALKWAAPVVAFCLLFSLAGARAWGGVRGTIPEPPSTY